MLIKMKQDFECEIDNIRYSKKDGNALEKDQVFDATFEQVLFLVEKKRVAEVVPLPKKEPEKKAIKVEPPVKAVVSAPIAKPVVVKKPVKKTPAKPRKRASRKKK